MGVKLFDMPPCRAEFENERIPTLKEAVALCKELGLVMLIELKNTSDIEKVGSVEWEMDNYIH